MEERNWGSSENGAQIVEVSEGTSFASGSASNLLNSREDELWIAGSVPQYVVLNLSPTHPPLRYAGWHVWHDYPTNPSKVEIASGESTDALTPLLVCRALPGAGTQLWLLPKPIPPQHLYVRLKITDSFTSGPTYMSTVILLANDPGPNYRSGALPAAVGAAAAEPQPDVSAATHSPRAAEVLPKIILRPGRAEQLPHPGATPNVASAGQSYIAFNTGSTPSAEPVSRTGRSTSAPVREKPARSRLEKLLRDLEGDIRNLHPIKGVRPPPNMLLPPPHTTSLWLPPTTDPSKSSSSEGEGNPADAQAARRAGERPSRSQKRPVGPPSTAVRPPAGVLEWDGAGVIAVPSQLSGLVTKLGDRVGILEQAVASLTQTVQHQREDLTMMKRLLLQQAMERRKESESKGDAYRDEAQRHASALLASSPLAHRLTHHEIDVNFPEDALRGYVESVMEERLQRLLKKSESKTLKRLDMYLKDVVRCIVDTIETQLNHNFQPQRGSNQAPFEMAKNLANAGSNDTREAWYRKSDDGVRNHVDLKAPIRYTTRSLNENTEGKLRV